VSACVAEPRERPWPAFPRAPRGKTYGCSRDDVSSEISARFAPPLRLVDPFASNRDAPILGDTPLLESVNGHGRKVEQFALVGRG
jgi:hypothetical protein